MALRWGARRSTRASTRTQATQQGGATARNEREALAHEIPKTTPKGAGVAPNAAKHGPPTHTTTIDAADVTASATTPAKRPPVDLNPAVRPLSRGVAVVVGGAGVGLAGLGLARLAEETGEAIYTAGEEQRPYTQTLPDGKSVLVMDPVTGESYILVVKEGGGMDIHDPNGPEGGPGGGGGGYGFVPVSDGGRADAEAQKDAFSGLFNPWVLLGLLALLIVIVVVASRKRGGAKSGSAAKGAST